MKRRAFANWPDNVETTHPQDAPMADFYLASEVDALLLEKEREIAAIRAHIAFLEQSGRPVDDMQANVHDRPVGEE